MFDEYEYAVTNLTIPSHLAERSRLILKHGDPSLLSTFNQVRKLMLAFQAIDPNVIEAQMEDHQGPLSLGYFKHRNKPVTWVQFGNFGSTEPTFALMPRGERIRCFAPDFEGAWLKLGKPVSLSTQLRRRTLEAIAFGRLVDLQT